MAYISEEKFLLISHFTKSTKKNYKEMKALKPSIPKGTRGFSPIEMASSISFSTQ